jgi:vacuolar protein sorting-associated protein 13A/C
MKKGFASAKTSLYSGVTGVFTKPLEGAKNEGLIGFLKGGIQGAAGLVTKTISGGIDIIAKTSEGLDYQSKN